MQLGFDIDWGGIATNLTKGVLQYQQGRDSIKLQMAQLQAQQAAQQRAMQPPPAVQSAVMPAPQVGTRTGTVPIAYRTTQPGLPTWALVAGVGVLAAFSLHLLRKV